MTGAQWLDDTMRPFLNLRIARKMFILTASMGGLQIVWSTITSNGTPFLLSLGFSKSETAIVWSLAPICGTFIQPYFGMFSDQSENSIGRRKPLMLVGAIATSVSLMGFALSESISNMCIDFFPTQLPTYSSEIVTKVVAVLCFCALNISIQPVQVASRAFIIESCAPEDQLLAHAWTSRVQGAGSIAGFLLASASLQEIFPYGSLSQFSSLCFVVSILLLGSVLLSCVLVPEDLSRGQPAQLREKNIFPSYFATILTSIKRMPKSIRQVCCIQCFSWMGWFPFLMYYTTYVSGTYQRSISSAGLEESAEIDALAESMKIGSFTGLLLACIAFVANLVLPTIADALRYAIGERKRSQCSSSTKSPQLALLYVWMFAHAFFALGMFLTFFVTSLTGRMILVASIGLCWAVTLWVPYSIIGVILSNGNHAVHDEPETGSVMGLHNAAISAPQIVSALISSIVFGLFGGADNSVSWILAIGGCWAVVSAAFSLKAIQEEEFAGA